MWETPVFLGYTGIIEVCPNMVHLSYRNGVFVNASIYISTFEELFLDQEQFGQVYINNYIPWLRGALVLKT